MTMTKSKKTILGILTFSPFIFVIWYFISIFSFMKVMTAAMDHPVGGTMEMIDPIKTLVIPVLIGFCLSIGLLIYYLVDILKLNPNFKKDTNNNKVIWILVVLLCGFLGMIVYFFVEIVPRGTVAQKQPADICKIEEN